MSAKRVKSLVKKIRGNGITPERLRNLEVLVALSLLLDSKTWKRLSQASRERAMKEDLLPLLVEINACIWQAIGEFYDADVSVETEVAFNQVRCKLSELQSTKDVAEMLATA